MKLETVFLDMDGVLCDFTGAAMRLHGREDLLQPGAWPRGVYTLEDVLCCTAAEFWQPINAAGLDFWAGLPALPWADRLFDAATRFARNVRVLTKPSRCPGSAAGKVVWLQNRFGPTFDAYHLTPFKSELARSRRVLVDDCEQNIKQWRNAGGVGLVFPQPWNNGGGDIDTVLAELARVAR